MRRALFPTALAAALALFAAPAALAQATGAQTPGTQAQSAGQPQGEALRDRDVYTTDNVEIGEIEDVIIDPAQGRVVAVVIELERFLGLTERYIALPLDRLRITPGQRRVTVAMTRDEIRAVPGIRYRD
jgi:sporulation protein YlmC with PRC-barrel domain